MGRKNKRQRTDYVPLNMLAARQTGRDEVVVLSARRGIPGSLVGRCMAALRRQLPGVPVRRYDGDTLNPGVNVHVDTDTSTLWIEGVGMTGWTRHLDLAALPDGLTPTRPA